MEKRFLITVKGRVQKVGFRAFAANVANRLELKGFVKNLPDGSVFIDASGDEDKLKLFLDYIKTGPTLAVVSDVIIEEDQLPSHYSNFMIHY
jgi:acylphosphatase